MSYTLGQIASFSSAILSKSLVSRAGHCFQATYMRKAGRNFPEPTTCVEICRRPRGLRAGTMGFK
jgi:hypothetical protein